MNEPLKQSEAEQAALDYLQEARDRDNLNYLLGTFDQEKAPRMAPVARAIFEAVQEGPRSWAYLVAIGHQASDVQVKSVDNWIRMACRIGVLTRQGEYSSWYNRKIKKRVSTDTRQVGLGPEAGRVSW
jgi:hypothetical protein